MKKALFETEKCGRCGGSGNYSFNMMHGSTCYGCGGSGLRLTKRGRAAQDFFRASLEVPQDEVKVGDVVMVTVNMAGTKRPATVVGIMPDDLNPDRGPIFNTVLNSNGNEHNIHTTGACTMTRPRTQADVDAALAYQATLTKAGKVRKSAKI